MAGVGRVEGAAEQADALARPRQAAAQGGAQARAGREAGRSAQGRTCPVPRTTYL